MSAFVVDTNVPVVANGGSDHIGDRCILDCIAKLEQIVQGGIVVIDEDGEIFSEYAKHLEWKGSPGMGNAFFKHVHNHMHNCKKVRMVSVTPIDDSARGFAELPCNDFDPSDRKFLAAALVARVPVLNASDSDWREHRILIERLGVDVHELCPDELKRARA